MNNKKSFIYLVLTITCWNVLLFSSRENFVPIDQAGVKRLKFGKTVFDNARYNLFLGASESPIVISPDVVNPVIDAKTFAITRTEGPLIIPITPAEISVPNAEGTAYEKKENDLYGKVILNLGLFNKSYPVVSYQEDSTDDTKKDDSTLVYLINSYNDGKMNIKTESALKDFAAADTKQIKAITGSEKYVFAAVSATGQDWSSDADAGDNRGIAVLKPVLSAKIPTIAQIAPTDLSNDKPDVAAVKAVNVDVTIAGRLVIFSGAVPPAIPIAKALIGPDVDMYWDAELKRLFIGLSDVHRDDQTHEGGCISVLVGRVEKTGIGTSSEKDNSFVLAPILFGPSKGKFTENLDNRMVGFYYNVASDVKISAKKVRVMHTSTGYSYLIVHCNVINGTDVYNKVFALPVLGAKMPDGKSDIPEGQIGTLSKINGRLPTFAAVPADASEMPMFDAKKPIDPTKTNSWVVVGQSQQDVGNLTDLFICGDSVFVCLNATGNPQASGIFQSTALFDENGIILEWTPWQRVMGDVQQVYGGGIDDLSNFYFLAEGPSGNPSKQEPNTIRFTQWGTTAYANSNETIDSKTGKPVWTNDETRNLSSLLAKIFPQNQGGIFQIINFDENTPGFSQKNFSMMVAVGYDKVALIQTLQMGSGGKFVPVTHFNDGTVDTTVQNVFVFENNSVLKEIAPLCFAEVARSKDDDSGWLFVGGYGGVAVLSKEHGEGWESQALGLSALTETAFPGAGYSFKKLNPTDPKNNFNNVRKLASMVSNDAKKLFIQTKDSLYAIDQDKDKFKDVSVDLDEHNFFGVTLPKTLKFADLLIIPTGDPDPNTAVLPASDKFKFILGSTHGLLTGIYAKGSGNITLSGLGSVTTDPVLHLNYISKTKGLNSATGNLYALSANFLQNTGKVNRYYVNGGAASAVDACKPISFTGAISPFIDLYNFRGDFVTDGTFGFSMIARGPLNNFLTDMYQIAQPQTETGSIDELLELNESNWYIGVITRNTASGSWLVPGDWGVKVNE